MANADRQLGKRPEDKGFVPSTLRLFLRTKKQKKGGEGFREKSVCVKRKWFQAIPLTLKAIFIPKDETPRNYYLLVGNLLNLS